jgi:hypothetical protein
VGNRGGSNTTGKSTGRASCPPGRVAVSSSRCSRQLASAPPWEHHPPLIRCSADPLGLVLVLLLVSFTRPLGSFSYSSWVLHAPWARSRTPREFYTRRGLVLVLPGWLSHLLGWFSHLLGCLVHLLRCLTHLLGLISRASSGSSVDVVGVSSDARGDLVATAPLSRSEPTRNSPRPALSLKSTGRRSSSPSPPSVDNLYSLSPRYLCELCPGHLCALSLGIVMHYLSFNPSAFPTFLGGAWWW